MSTRQAYCLLAVVSLSACCLPPIRAAEIDLAALAGSKLPPDAIWLDSLDVNNFEQGWGQPRARRSVDRKPLTIHGQVFKHGVGTHAVSEVNIALNGAAEQFVSMVGVDDDTDHKGSVSFEVLVDNKKVADSGRMVGGDAPKRLQADLHGAKRLTLLVGDADDGNEYDHADWAGAVIVLAAEATTRPQTLAIFNTATVPADISHPDAPEPAIHGPRIVGSTPGHAFLFLIPATGEKPLHFAAKNLPDGLKLNPDTGIISGSLLPATVNGTSTFDKKTGTLIVSATNALPDPDSKTVVELQVSNSRGTAKRELTIVGGAHKLALTPPMGWNSWNCWAGAVSDAKVRAAADYMAKSGLAAHGFQYVNIDDCWEGGRDKEGNIETNQKFPDMRALSDYVHSKGLRLGIYSSPGPKTCAGFAASYKHEAQDARTYARWGVDYLKYDWCSYDSIARSTGANKPYSKPVLMKPYEVMQAGLDDCGRDIVYSLCQYGMGDVWTWGADVGGNCWRTTGDINDSWSSLSSIGFKQNGHEKYAGPGHWNDPDMLVVGKVGWGPSLHPTKLKPNEQLTHISLWCLLSSPLLIGCDMSSMDPFTLALLTNDEALDINQDPLGKPAGRVAQHGLAEIWARPLFDGTSAVGLFNRGLQEAKVKVRWTDLKREGAQPVRDLWQHKDMGESADGYEASVPPHGVVLIKVGKAK